MTRLGEAEDALLACLLAVPELDALKEGKPQLWEPQSKADEHVWIMEEAIATRAPSQTGNTPEYREEFDLFVVVAINKTAGADDFAPVRDRGIELTNLIEQVLIDEPRLGTGSPGGSRIWHADVRGTERFSASEDERRYVWHITTVHVVAYLRGGP